MTMERWSHYQDQLRGLGLYGVMQGGGRVEFRVDPGSLSNGDSYKGYEYTPTPHHPIRSKLDGYRIADADKTPLGGWLAHAPLAANWYLYLFVNR